MSGAATRLATLLVVSGFGSAQDDPLLASIGLPDCSNPMTRNVGEFVRSGDHYRAYEHVWDWNDDLRQTRRLLIFREGEYLGHYYTTGRECEVTDGNLVCVYFGGNAEAVSLLEEGAPSEIFLHGEVLRLDSSEWQYNFCED